MARDTHLASSLREKLGADSAGQWIDFMDSLGASLPFLLRSAGRPSNAEIANSAIGAGGFTSWRQMVESSPAWGGLGWSYDTYKSWKKAYALVQKHPYLRDLMLSSSEINTIQRENKEFPASREAYDDLKKGRKDAQEERRLNSVKALQAQLSNAKQQAAAAQTALEASRASEASLKSLESQLRQELAQSNEKIGALQVQVERSTSLAEKRKSKIEALEKDLEAYGSLKIAHGIFKKYVQGLWNSSRWQLFVAFCKGSLPRPQEVIKTVNRKS